MSETFDSLLAWGLGAIGLFWFVGAYNRIMRLRAAALQAFALLEQALQRQIDYVRGHAEAATPPNDLLRATTDQLVILLAATRLRPLDVRAMGALLTALQVMLRSWERLHPDAVVSFDADGTLSRPAALVDGRMSEGSATRAFAWPEPSAAAEIARQQFNAAVAQYNGAIAQFPARLVAWIMQLKRAAPLA